VWPAARSNGRGTDYAQHVGNRGWLGSRLVALGGALDELTLQIGYQLPEIGRIRRCCFRTSPSMGKGSLIPSPLMGRNSLISSPIEGEGV